MPWERLAAALQQLPPQAAAAVACAFLVEIALYAATGSPRWRQRLARPALLTVTAMTPYCLYSLPAGVFRWQSLALLALLAASVALWFAVLPRRPVVDAGFLLLMSAVYLTKVFRDIYADPAPELRVDSLGQLMWIRLGIIAVLSFRPMDGIGFGFLPSRPDWRIGLRYFWLFLPAGLLLGWALGFARWAPSAGWWWKAPATFIGILWVVALAEEFFFRGLLQQWLDRWLGPRMGLILTSALFGAVHLGFRQFPNWKMAAMAAVAGGFYGLAFRAGGGIRAPMVTHALVVAGWRTLFS